MIKVCKFGGTSMADGMTMRRVKDIFESNPGRRYIVVSAPGKRFSGDIKVTDLLYETEKEVDETGRCGEAYDKICQRFRGIVQELNIDLDIDAILKETKAAIEEEKSDDFTASRGEYLSGRVMAALLDIPFIDARDVIKFDASGKLDSARSFELLGRALTGKPKALVTGFYGEGTDGKVKTFSRGGSDISGAIVARAAGAALYENWTDVSGMYAADPRIVKDAKVIEELTYTQVRELSDVGASVFHEEAIAPVIEKGIAINIRDTNAPEDPGTMIRPSSEKKGIIGVSAKGGYSKLKLRKLMMFKRPGMRHAMLTMLHLYGVRPSFSFFGIDSIVWYFESGQANDSVLKSMVERLKKDFQLDYAYYERDHAMLGIVGGHLDDDTSFITACAALKEAGIRINNVNYGSSNTTTLIGVNDSDAKRAVEVIYKALF